VRDGWEAIGVFHGAVASTGCLLHDFSLLRINGEKAFC